MTAPKKDRVQIIYTRGCVQCGKSFRPGRHGSEWNAIYCNFCLDSPKSTLAIKRPPGTISSDAAASPRVASRPPSGTQVPTAPTKGAPGVSGA